MLQIEFAFTLPCGYLDEHGALYTQGVMRRATALDEIEPLKDARVRENEAYFSILLLSRVVSQLGELRPVPPSVIEALFAPDFEYLQELYTHINEPAGNEIETQCPRCGLQFALDLTEANDSA